MLARHCRTKLTLPAMVILGVYIASIVITIALIGTIFFVRGRILMEHQLKDKLISTATAAALRFERQPLERIIDERSLDDPVFRTVVADLDTIRTSVSGVRYAYIMRSTEQPGMFAFVADADWSLTDEELDRNGNGIVEASEKPAMPGEQYNATNMPALQEAYLHPTVDAQATSDVWGTMISGYAPIRTASGDVMGILGIDMDAGDFYAISRSILSPMAFLLILLFGILLSGIVTLALSRQQLSILKTLDTERSGLLRLTFHQMGSPITILNWSLELLKEKCDPAGVREHISVMEDAMSRLCNISNSLRDAERVHDGNIRYRPSIASLNAVILESAREISQRLGQKHQRLSLELHADLNMKLDAKLIQAVLRELIGNAMDFSPPQSTITIATRRHGRYARIEVRDSGHGIPKEDMKRMFQEFSRGSNATLYKSDGSGLGLYIVRGIIDEAQGRIWIESQESRGTSVIFELPLVQ